jgi:RNA polymerase sigma-70 factor (ECF subfamily)
MNSSGPDARVGADERVHDLRELVRQCLTGDQAAMLALVERFRGQVFGLCYRMLGQRQDAEDAAQETFVRVLKNLHRWDPTRDCEPWLLAIAGNRCRTALSTRKRRPAGSDALIDQVPDDAPDVRAAQHLAEEVHLALASVRGEYRQAFVLFHENELSYAEIAESMDVPLGTVKTWVHRARRDLIQELRRRGVLPELRPAELTSAALANAEPTNAVPRV